jgi:hypothetical protein
MLAENAVWTWQTLCKTEGNAAKLRIMEFLFTALIVIYKVLFSSYAQCILYENIM